MTTDRRQALALLFAAAATPALAGAKPARPARWAAAEAAAQALITERLTPGLQVCVRRRGQTLFSRGFGMASLEDATPMTPLSIGKIGSVTKQFTAAAILLLAEDGKLSLDDPLARFLPDFPRAADLPLRRMLNHTSGLGNYTDTATRNDFAQMTRIDRDTAALVDLMRAGAKVQVFEPGTSWAYSNTAYVLLGVVIEKVTGRPYSEFFQTRLFKPAGLARTAVDDMAEVVPGRASGYSNAPKAPSGFANTSFISMTAPGGAGNLRSTMTDLCAWHEALLGGRVLQPASLQAMLTPSVLNDGALPTSPRGGKDGKIRYGLGQFLEDSDGYPSIWHRGGINGFSTDLRSYTDQGVTLALILNTDGGPPSARRNDLRQALLTAALA